MDADDTITVEAVARAICESMEDEPDSLTPGFWLENRDGIRPNWEGYEDAARAAIAAYEKAKGGKTDG